MSVTIHPSTNPNMSAGSGESQRIPHEKIQSAFPQEHLKTAVIEAEQAVADARERVAHDPEQIIPEYDIEAERAQIEMARQASSSIMQVRMEELQRLNQWSNN